MKYDDIRPTNMVRRASGRLGQLRKLAISSAMPSRM
jgi:hypothetical protein